MNYRIRESETVADDAKKVNETLTRHNKILLEERDRYLKHCQELIGQKEKLTKEKMISLELFRTR